MGLDCSHDAWHGAYKAELMRLADEYAKATGMAANKSTTPAVAAVHADGILAACDARNLLSVAITAALADARREALEEAAKVCATHADEHHVFANQEGTLHEDAVTNIGAVMGCDLCEDSIRKLVDGQEGGT